MTVTLFTINTSLCLSEWSRLVKSESSDSLCSQSSGSSGTHPAIRSLRQQTRRSQSISSSINTSASSATRETSGKHALVNLKCEGTGGCVSQGLLYLADFIDVEQ